MILLPIILAVLAGFVLIFIPENRFSSREALLKVTGASFCISAFLAVYVISTAAGESLTLFYLVDDIPVYFVIDNLGRLFMGIVLLVFLLTGFFSFSYMKNENRKQQKKEKRYYGFYLITFGILTGLAFAGNLVTLYLFYEFMTLASMPLVLHSETKESIMAGLKYLFYSLCGAYMALFGIYVLYQYAGTLDFAAGGVLNAAVLIQSGNTELLLLASFFIIIGFGVKAGCFPFHAWLLTAHPAAPAPASAFLSGIIVKGGVLAIIRVVFYCIGADFIRGTWVQTIWIIFAIITIFMGSFLAFKEKIVKKRLAYSTVANLSYILLGLAMLNATSFVGSLLHVVFHAVIKSALFLIAGVLFFCTGKTKATDFAGLGKRMPVIFGCWTIVSLGLIGIPPASGVISKWYLALGSLESQIAGFSWIGAASLFVSAFLTAGYLLPVSVAGCLQTPVNESVSDNHKKPSLFMLIPIVILAALTVFFGVYPTPLINFIATIADGLL